MEAIMMSASTVALEALLPKLGQMLTDKYKLHKGAKEGIQYIHNELVSMKAALQKVSKVPPDQLDGQDKIWAREVRKMSYKIENTIDSFMVLVDAVDGESDESSTTCCISMISKPKLLQRYKARESIATEIERIKKEVEDLSNRRNRYKLDSITEMAPAGSDPRLPALYEDKTKLVGIDRPTQEIIKLLSKDEEGSSTSEQKLKLVSIVGPGGMGKTILANVVFHKLEENFDCTAFVSVSLQPNMKNILSSILRQVTASEIRTDQVEAENKGKDKRLHHRESQKHYGSTETWSEKELIDKIRQVLEKRRYLILIDDIWDKQTWKFIECALFENKLGSKVITTTRNIEVAKSCCSSDKVDGIIHELEPLSDDDSKQLLYYKIFGMEGCPTELEAVSQKVLEKCKGWPLAITAIAGLLKPTQSEDQWNSVYNSINTGQKIKDGLKSMRTILYLSYRDMPAQLRDCLLYLSIFPEDHTIGRYDLIQRWIAEGLVHGSQDDNLHELGDEYFNELINRSMIQPRDVDAFGRAQSSTVHDLVLEFVNFLSAEEDFVTIFFFLERAWTRIAYRLSLYADDLVIFVVPTQRDIEAVRTILEMFAAASGLHTNVSKCQFTPIRCSDEEVQLVQSLFPCQLIHFPCRYLGVPLSVYKLNKADLQPLVDVVADRLPTWKARLLSKAGRTTLTKVTLSAIPIHVSIAVEVSPWIYSAVDRIRRGFVWTGTDSAPGGRCTVAWSKVARPLELGGLGVIDLTTMGYALRLRWEWLARTDPARAWVALPSKEEKVIRAMFDASTTVQVGCGSRVLFWTDRWLDGASIGSFASDVVAAVPKASRKRRLVSEALQNDRWIADISGSLSTRALHQYVLLWERLQGIHLQQGVQDKFVWKWTANQQYSASSAYRAFFHGQCGVAGAKELSKLRAPPRCKFFLWLALLGRCWTAERRQRHHLQSSDACTLCGQGSETIAHLLLFCVFAREIWFKLLRRSGYPHLTPTGVEKEFQDWWLPSRKRLPKELRKGFDTLVALVTWSLWKERNARVFDNIARQPAQLLQAILDEGRLWSFASFSALSGFIP